RKTMQKTKIEWCDSTWNPITGCRFGCSYCYAKKIAERFGTIPCENSNCIWCQDCKENPQTGFKCEAYEPIEKIHTLDEKQYQFNPKRMLPFPYGFEPIFHRYRLDEPQKAKKPQRIFVVSMGDMFGDWVPEYWITEVFDACRKAPQHKYMFLTKNPKRYKSLLWDRLLPEEPNFFYGTTINRESQLDEAFWCWDQGVHTFLSIEPILEPFSMNGYDLPSVFTHDLVIIGAETGNRKEKVIPEASWIKPIVKETKSMNGRVFMKESLLPVMGEDDMLRELPLNLMTKKEIHK
ncbi:MAG: DUF5131 family protein, partial [Sphaerochaetaceae bacterium]